MVDPGGHRVNPLVVSRQRAHDGPMNEKEFDPGSNASGNQSGDEATTYDVVDSGQSEDIENSLTGQGTSDRITLTDIHESGDAELESPDGYRG